MVIDLHSACAWTGFRAEAGGGVDIDEQRIYTILQEWLLRLCFGLT